ncbi:hypothetical protein ACO0QE_002762 [Hanseniaspora vineae]
MGIIYSGFVIVLMAQLVLLLFSPRYHQRSRILHWYYTTIFKPLFSATSTTNTNNNNNNNNNTNSLFQKCKYYFVPIFYLFLYNYLAFYLFYYKLSQALVKIGLVGIIESQVVVPLLLLIPLISGVLCFWYSAKMFSIRANSYQQLDESVTESFSWPYDDLIFFSTNNICSTCEKIKPPRSKHCSICNVCVPFQDHHCIWFNCCISGTNYKWFYVFLVSNWFILAYGALRLTYIQYGQTKVAIPQYYRNSVLTLIILCFCFMILLSWFLYTQWELVKEGMTTNECDKWYTVHELIEDKLLIKSTKSGKYYERYNNAKINSSNNNTKDAYGISLNPNDNKIYNLENMFEIVQSPYEITNIYDKGSFWENFKERMNY